jgi:DNA transposition AAA+ family ATPase
MITDDYKRKIVEAIKADRDNHRSQAKQAKIYDVSAAQLSRILKGDIVQVISEAKWISIARRLGVNTKDEKPWNTAKTDTFNTIYAQLTACQTRAISAIMCDIADIGKTYTAKCYVREHKEAIYIDCSQVKSKQQLVRQMAREYGLDSRGRLKDVQDDLKWYLCNIASTPLIILDEAGDLNYSAFLELKALWNATEHYCGWYMMGADGLKVKIDANVGRKKVGYTEIFSRFGNKYQRVSPEGGEALEQWKKLQTTYIGRANASNVDIQKLYSKTNGSLRRIFIELRKQSA